MESKKINQLATSVSPQTSDLTIIGDPTTGVSKKITLLQIANLFATTGTVSSVAVTESGDALTITGSPITSAGTINIGFAGDATQYVRGDGALADFPTSTGGGSSVSYYLNSSVSQGTISGVAYRELSKDPISGAGTDITISANGYVASYITDANDPALLEVPGGNFNCEFYFSVNSNAHNPYVYAELYKYDGTTFTLIGSSQSVPEYLTNGTTLSPYYFAIPVAQTVLTITDRIAIRIFVNVDGRTVTLHTENNHLCQVVTTFSKGLTTLNNLTRQVQFLATGTSGTDFNISSSTATHTFNIPSASASNRGLITTGTQTIAGDKTLNGNTDFVGNSNFSGYAIFSNAIPTQINYGAKIAKGSIPATFGSDSVNLYSDATTNNIIFRDNLSIAKLLFNNSTQTFTFPAASGTIALTSNLSSYVPYTGATTNVDLGASNNLSANNITALGSLKSDFGLLLKSGLVSTVSGYLNISAQKISGNSQLNVYTDTGFSFSLSAPNNANYTYSFPSSSGTLALTSDLSAYLPLTGGTLTGALSGTSATFSGNLNLQAGAVRNINFYDSSNTNINAQIQYDQISSNSGQLFFGTNNAGTFATRLTIASTGAATFSSSVTANGLYANAGNSARFYRGANDYYWGINNDSNNYLNFGTFAANGTAYGTNPKMILLDNGNVGIGTTSPNAKLQVGGFDNPNALVIAADPSSPSSLYFGDGTGAALNRGFVEYAHENDTMYIGTSATTRLTIASTGAATFSSSVTANSSGSLFNANTGGLSANILTIKGGGGSGAFGFRVEANNGDAIFRTNNYSYNVLMCENAGSVGIGTSAPTNTLTIQNTGENAIEWHRSNVMQGMIGIPSASNQIIIGSALNDFCFRATTNMLFATGGETERMRITSGGYIVTSAVTYGNTSGGAANMFLFGAGDYGIGRSVSSAKYKTQIEDVEESFVSNIYKMRPIWYRSICERDRKDWSHFGFVAEEIAEIEPRLVHWDKDEEGNLVAEGVQYDRITVLLVAEMQKMRSEIQEQQAQIEELKAMIAAK